MTLQWKLTQSYLLGCTNVHQWFLAAPANPHPIRCLDRYIRFCSARRCAQHRDTYTHRHTRNMRRLRQQAASMRCMRCDLKQTRHDPTRPDPIRWVKPSMLIYFNHTIVTVMTTAFYPGDAMLALLLVMARCLCLYLLQQVVLS